LNKTLDRFDLIIIIWSWFSRYMVRAVTRLGD